MSLILSLRMTGVTGLTTDIRSVVQRASAQVGQVVEIPEAVADRVGNELTAQAVAHVIEVRRRERSVPADVLALHLG